MLLRTLALAACSFAAVLAAPVAVDNRNPRAASLRKVEPEVVGSDLVLLYRRGNHDAGDNGKRPQSRTDTRATKQPRTGKQAQSPSSSSSESLTSWEARLAKQTEELRARKGAAAGGHASHAPLADPQTKDTASSTAPTGSSRRKSDKPLANHPHMTKVRGKATAEELSKLPADISPSQKGLTIINMRRVPSKAKTREPSPPGHPDVEFHKAVNAELDPALPAASAKKMRAAAAHRARTGKKAWPDGLETPHVLSIPAPGDGGSSSSAHRLTGSPPRTAAEELHRAIHAQFDASLPRHTASARRAAAVERARSGDRAWPRGNAAHGIVHVPDYTPGHDAADARAHSPSISVQHAARPGSETSAAPPSDRSNWPDRLLPH